MDPQALLNAVENFHDGQLLPMDCIAVCPSSDADVAELMRLIPVTMATEVARWAAWRALGRDATPPASFRI